MIDIIWYIAFGILAIPVFFAALGILTYGAILFVNITKLKTGSKSIREL